MFFLGSFWQLFRMGGVTMYLLFGYSVLSLAIIIERCFYYRKKSRVKRQDFMLRINKEIKQGSLVRALELCKTTDVPFAKVVAAGLDLYGHSESVISNAMERQITVETLKLERFTSIVGTIASTSVYIGLFGTVLGILRVFHDISKTGSGGVSVVIAGISEALITTAAGLFIAVPAVIAYNYFIRKIDAFVTEMELSASETMDLLSVFER